MLARLHREADLFAVIDGVPVPESEDALRLHVSEVAALRGAIARVDEALQEMIAKYDADMGGLADKMKDVQEKFNTELKQFEELKEYFTVYFKEQGVLFGIKGVDD